MNDRAYAVVEDGVVVVLTVLREAMRAAFFAAMEIFRAEIPATRTLHQIASDRRHVADLRSGNSRCSFGQGGILLLDGRMFFDLRERDQRPDAEPLVIFADLI